MEIWYGIGTNEVKAVYEAAVKAREGYNGTAWTDAGCDVYRDSAPLPRSMMPGAILEFDIDGKPQVKTPAPVPPAPPPPRDYEAELDAAGQDIDAIKAVMKAYIGRR